MNIQERILEILSGMNADADFAHSENFIEDGLLDSFEIVNLVSELEDAFEIEIRGKDIVPENFENIDRISALIGKYKEGK